jgi:spectrin beta
LLLDEEGAEGYRPCDPSIIVERVQALEDAYAELVKLAVERRYQSKLIFIF